MNRSEKWQEHLRSMIVGILLLILICLCVIYILSFSGVEEFEFSAQDMEAVSNESIRYQYLDYWNQDFVSPAFIGFSWKKSGENVGFHTLGGENAEVYQSILPFFEKLFGSEGTMQKLSKKDGEAIFHSLLKSSYIYVSYACDLPTSVISSFTEEADFSGESGEYIREILIVPEEYLWQTEIRTPTGETKETVLYSFYAIARDQAGNYYRYSTKYLPKTPTDIAFHTNFYLTYNEAENALPYEFAYILKQDDFLQKINFSEKVTDTTIIPLHNPSYSTPVVFAESRIASGADMHPILESFYMNPEQTTSYTDDNGIIFYFDEGQTVSVSPTGELQYSSHGTQGISLETLFGWHTGETEYGFFDYLGAALIASHQLGEAHAHTNCKPYLAGIDYDGNALTIRFGYAAGGFPLFFNGEQTIMSFTFSGDMMQSAEYRFWTVHMTALISEAPDFLWTLRTHLADTEQSRHYFYGYYFSKDRSRCGVDVLAIPQSKKE